MSELNSIQEHRLDNGLKVLIKPMRTAPVASVWIWYRVGSRYESPGITGVSHWVEHMLFKGTPSLPKGEIMKSVNRVGGMNNGFTRQDNTVYFETVPSDHLDLALRIEADRMVNSTFDPQEVASERTVIISEREGAENYPQMRLSEEVLGAAYQVHPYRWPVVGYKCDLQKMTRDELFDYYRRHYAPDNATLVLVGDFGPAGALEAAKRRFADIQPSGGAHEVRAEEPEQFGERRVEVRRPGNAVYWTCAYHIPAHSHADRLPLMVLEAMLSGARSLSFSGGGYLGKSARLYDALVNRKKLAVWAGGGAHFAKDPGLFSLWMMLRDGVQPEKAEKAILGEIEKLRDAGPRAAELKTALHQVRAQVEYARDGITANAYMIGDLDSLDSLDELDTMVERVAAVTAEDVVRVARTYLVRKNRTVGVFMPEGQGLGGTGGPPAMDCGQRMGARLWPTYDAFLSDAPPAGSESGRATVSDRQCHRIGWFGAPAGLSGGIPLPPIQRRQLDCGVNVFGMEHPDSHCMVIAGFLRAGAVLDPAGREGVAYLTGRMLDQGTSRRNCRQIAAQMDRIGASIYFGAGMDSTGLGGKCLPRDLPRVLALLAECLSDVAAPAEELEKVRAQTLTGLKADRDSTAWLAMRAALENLYPAGHPYRRDTRGTPEAVAGISRDEVLDFARGCFGPQNLTLVLVGPLPFGRVCQQVDRAFGSWRQLDRVPAFEPKPVTAAAAPGETALAVPGKSQCDIVMAWMAVPRLHPDYHALLVGSTILGQFGLMGRIGERVRDRMGLAYYAMASLDARLQAGHWVVRAGVNPANVRKAIAAIREETGHFCTEPVTEQELSDTVGYLVGSLSLEMETSDSLAHVVRDIAFYGLPLDYLERYSADVRAVTGQRVLELAAHYLATAQPVVSIAGPQVPAGD